MRVGSICEDAKNPGMPERSAFCGHQFGRRKRRVHGAEPASEAAPHLGGVVDRQVLQQPLGNASQLNMDVGGVQFTADRGAISMACPVQILVAVAAAQGLHPAHPN